MPDSRHEGLLERILASKQFAHAESLKRILRYICSQFGVDGKAPIREYDLAVNALGRPSSFDVKADPIVRVSVAGIRERLQSYFDSEGSAERVRVQIPAGQFDAVFTTVSDEEEPGKSAMAIARFWRPYLNSGTPNVLIYAEVLFFRSDDFSYVRNIFVNDSATGLEEMRTRLPGLDLRGFLPSYHFAAAGEMHCVLFLTKHFQDFGARLEVRTARHSAWNELRLSNVIFIGSSRTNTFIDSLMGEQPFVLTQDSIRNRDPKAGEPAEYVSRRYMEGSLQRVTEYALITRQPGLGPDTCTTILSGNHGRANEAAGFYVTREDALQRMLRSMNIADGDPLPACFQVVLQVELIDLNEDVVSVEYLTHRVF
jgi:hypothetical protein